MARTATHRANLQFDRIAATGAALVVIGLAVFLLIRNEEIADPQLFFVLRVVLSLSTATLGATIPGLLEVDWSGRGLAIRAGGALALFVLTFIYTPDLATHQGRLGTQNGQSAGSADINVIGGPCGVTAGIKASGNTVNCTNVPASATVKP
jgi:hypothetical protein